jgi:hypothetical protein
MNPTGRSGTHFVQSETTEKQQEFEYQKTSIRKQQANKRNKLHRQQMTTGNTSKETKQRHSK